MELRWLYDRRSLEEARRDLGVWLAKWQTRYLNMELLREHKKLKLVNAA